VSRAARLALLLAFAVLVAESSLLRHALEGPYLQARDVRVLEAPGDWVRERAEVSLRGSVVLETLLRRARRGHAGPARALAERADAVAADYTALWAGLTPSQREAVARMQLALSDSRFPGLGTEPREIMIRAVLALRRRAGSASPSPPPLGPAEVAWSDVPHPVTLLWSLVRLSEDPAMSAEQAARLQQSLRRLLHSLKGYHDQRLLLLESLAPEEWPRGTGGAALLPGPSELDRVRDLAGRLGAAPR